MTVICKRNLLLLLIFWPFFHSDHVYFERLKGMYSLFGYDCICKNLIFIPKWLYFCLILLFLDNDHHCKVCSFFNRSYFFKCNFYLVLENHCNVWKCVVFGEVDDYTIFLNGRWAGVGPLCKGDLRLLFTCPAHVCMSVCVGVPVSGSVLDADWVALSVWPCESERLKRNRKPC